MDRHSNLIYKMNKIRKRYKVPASVFLGFEDSDGSLMKIPLVAITKAGICFPLPRLLRQLLDILRLSPCQLCPKSYVIIGSILKLNEMKDIKIGVWEILYCYNVDLGRNGVYCLRGRKNRSIIECLFSEKYYMKKPSIFVGGKGWEFPQDEVKPIKCRRKLGNLAEVQYRTGLKEKINKHTLNKTVLNRDLGPLAAGFYWRSWPTLMRYNSHKLIYKVFTNLPIGVNQSNAGRFFSSEKFEVLCSKRNRNHTPAPTMRSIREKVDNKSIEGANVETTNNSVDTPAPTDAPAEEVNEKSNENVENSVDNLPEASSHELHNNDDMPALRTEVQETQIATEPGNNSIDDIPSLGIESPDLARILAPNPDLYNDSIVPPSVHGLFKRKQMVHLSAESLYKKGKRLHGEHACILNDSICSCDIRPPDKEKLDSMAPEDIVNYSKMVAEKIEEGYISATKEVSRLNTLVQSLERRASTAENKLLAVESFSLGYENEIHELKENHKLSEARSNEQQKQARAEAIEQCCLKYSKEVAVIVNHHYGHGWGGALMAAKVEEASPLWNSDSIPWPNEGVEFPPPDIRRLFKSDAFNNGPSGRPNV